MLVDNNIQNNDILSIVISSGAIAETAEPYNKANQVIGNSARGSQNQNLEGCAFEFTPF